MGFRLKLTIFMIIVVNISIILLGVFNTYKSYEITEQLTEKSAIDMVKIESSIITELIDKEKRFPNYLTKEPPIVEFLLDQQSVSKERKVTEILNSYISDKDNLDGIYLANLDGKIIATVSSDSHMIGLDLSGRSYYRKTLMQKKPILSETLTSQKSNEPIFVITHPILNREQQVIGFIGTIVLAKSIARYQKDMKLSGIESSYAFLVDEKGNYIYTPSLNKIGQTVEIPEIVNIMADSQNKEVVAASTFNYLSNNNSMIAAYSFIPETNWMLVVTGSLSELQSPIKTMNIFMVIMCIIFCSTTTLIIFYGTQWITQPVITDLENKNKKLNNYNEELAASEEELRVLTEQLLNSEQELRLQNDKLIESKDILDKKNRLLEIIMQASNDGIWYNDITTGELVISSNLMSFSTVNTKLKSYEDWEAFIHPEDKNRCHNKLKEFVLGVNNNFESIYRVRTLDGTYRWIRSKGMAFFDESGARYILAGVHTDIDDLKKQEEQLNYLAHHDPLTDLPNRNLLLDRLKMAIKMAQKDNGNLATLFIDIDNFKHINDSMGHKVGDDLLKQVALRLKEYVHEYDTVARFGGDEFVVIFQQIHSNQSVYSLCEKIKDSFLQPFYINQTSIFLSTSMGMAIYPYDGTSAEELLTNSDTAMYKAKLAGKNRINIFDLSMKNEVVKRMELEKALRLAIINNEFVLNYQPQYDTKNNRLRGFEALIRWNCPRKGVLSPAEFIPIAEETGMIIQIGQWVLKQACETMIRWINDFGFDGVIAVNVSSVQLKSDNFIQSVRSILAQTGLEPNKLEIEITESILIESFDLTVAKLLNLKKMGVRISLDDFGTGYSSLSYLKNIPADTLKIDKSFINEIKSDALGTEIVGSIINLVQKLNMETIAEGVESAEQYEYLKKVGCSYYQGYLMYKPIPEESINEILIENRYTYTPKTL